MYNFQYKDNYSLEDAMRMDKITADLKEIDRIISSLEEESTNIIILLQSTFDEEDRKIYYNNLLLNFSLQEYYRSLSGDLEVFKNSYIKIVSGITAVFNSQIGYFYKILADLVANNIVSSKISLFYFASLRKWRKEVDAFYASKLPFNFDSNAPLADSKMELPIDCTSEKTPDQLIGEETQSESLISKPKVKKLENNS